MRFFCLIALLIPTTSFGAVIEQAVMGGQPQMLMGDGRAKMCGLRVVVQPTTFVERSPPAVLMLDTSIVMSREGVVMIKGFAASATPEGLRAGKLTKAPPVELWFKTDGSRATSPSEGRTFVGEDGISLMYSDKAQYETYTSFLDAVLNGKPVSVGFRISPKDEERIASGRIQLSEPDLAAFMRCNSELVE